MIAFRGMHQELRPYAEEAVRIANQYGISPIITSVTRSMANQDRLRKNYEHCLAAGKFPSSFSFGSGLSCSWPANRPGDSAHNFAVAFDSWVPAKQVALWKQIREYIGFHVPENDVIHAELPNWRSYLVG